MAAAKISEPEIIDGWCWVWVAVRTRKGRAMPTRPPASSVAAPPAVGGRETGRSERPLLGSRSAHAHTPATDSPDPPHRFESEGIFEGVWRERGTDWRSGNGRGFTAQPPRQRRLVR